MPNTVLSPRPVPRSAGLVVKKGSNMRSFTSADIPCPVSSTLSPTYRPGCHGQQRTHDLAGLYDHFKEHLPAEVRRGAKVRRGGGFTPQPLREVEPRHIERVLLHHEGNRTRSRKTSASRARP